MDSSPNWNSDLNVHDNIDNKLRLFKPTPMCAKITPTHTCSLLFLWKKVNFAYYLSIYKRFDTTWFTTLHQINYLQLSSLWEICFVQRYKKRWLRVDRSSWSGHFCVSGCVSGSGRSVLVWSVIEEIPHENCIVMGTADYLKIVKLQPEHSAIVFL